MSTNYWLQSRELPNRIKPKLVTCYGTLLSASLALDMEVSVRTTGCVRAHTTVPLKRCIYLGASWSRTPVLGNGSRHDWTGKPLVRSTAGSKFIQKSACSPPSKLSHRLLMWSAARPTRARRVQGCVFDFELRAQRAATQPNLYY